MEFDAPPLIKPFLRVLKAQQEALCFARFECNKQKNFVHI
jgi:hypothetical protein